MELSRLGKIRFEQKFAHWWMARSRSTAHFSSDDTAEKRLITTEGRFERSRGHGARASDQSLDR